MANCTLRLLGVVLGLWLLAGSSREANAQTRDLRNTNGGRELLNVLKSLAQGNATFGRVELPDRRFKVGQRQRERLGPGTARSPPRSGARWVTSSVAPTSAGRSSPTT